MKAAVMMLILLTLKKHLYISIYLFIFATYLKETIWIAGSLRKYPKP